MRDAARPHCVACLNYRFLGRSDSVVQRARALHGVHECHEVFICFHAVHVPINPHYISINPYKSPSPSPSIRPQRSADRVQQLLLLPRESVVDTGAKPVGPGAFPMRAACMPGVFAARSQIG
jgi:hypothetical protein